METTKLLHVFFIHAERYEMLGKNSAEKGKKGTKNGVMQVSSYFPKNSLGVMPVMRLKRRVKWCGKSKPRSREVSLML